MLDNQIYTTCEGQSAIDLITSIDKKVSSLAEQYPEITVQSISHDVLILHSGAFHWTALITVNLNKKEQDVEDYD